MQLRKLAMLAMLAILEAGDDESEAVEPDESSSIDEGIDMEEAEAVMVGLEAKEKIMLFECE